MDYEFIHGKNLYKISLEKKNGRITATVENEQLEVDVCSISPNGLSLLIGNRSFRVFLAEEKAKRYVSVNGENYCFTSVDAEDCIGRGGGAAEAKLTITAPMPGSVLKINVEEGDEVEEGQCLAIVEAMKMETELCSTISGRVKKVHTELGKQVDGGEILIELEEEKNN